MNSLTLEQRCGHRTYLKLHYWGWTAETRKRRCTCEASWIRRWGDYEPDVGGQESGRATVDRLRPQAHLATLRFRGQAAQATEPSATRLRPPCHFRLIGSLENRQAVATFPACL
jgi:hypothetical protein